MSASCHVPVVSRRRRNVAAWLRVLAITAVVLLLLGGCKSPDDDAGSEEGSGESGAQESPGGAGGTAANPTKTGPAVANLSAAAELLQIERAALRNEIPQGNFATLTVAGESGAPVPLSIESVEVAVTIEGHMARTEVTQVFRNHQPRQTEGTYEFMLPDGAAISRLAMDVEGKMMEGELVERERARQIYEQIVSSMRDPALLEWQGGNRFKTQIFPIPPSGTKTVVLAYETLLPESRDGSRYVYSLPKLSGKDDAKTLGRFHFTLTSDHAGESHSEGYTLTRSADAPGTRLELDEQAFVPQGPLTVRFAGSEEARAPQVRFAQRSSAVAAADAAAQGQVAPPERFFAVDLVPKVPALTAGDTRGVVIALDTSAGLGQPVVDQARLAALMLVSGLPEGTPWRIVHGDYKAQACGEAAMSGTQPAVDCLKGLTAGGATDLDALLTRAVEAAGTLQGPTAIVLFSDGAASLGLLDGDVIRGRVERALAARSEVTLHTVAVGHAPSESELEKLAMAGSGHALRMTPVDAPDALASELAERIQEPVLSDVVVEVVEGTVEGLSPTRPRNLARGQGLVVLGKLVSQKAVLEVRGRHGDETLSQRIALTPDAGAMVESPLLANFWARASIDEMHERGVDPSEVVDFSLDYGVMSPYTSFLVLENEQAYERFAVERRKEAERLARDEAEKQEQKNLTKSDQDLKVVLEKKPQAAPTATETASPAPEPEPSMAPGAANEMELIEEGEAADDFAPPADLQDNRAGGGDRDRDGDVSGKKKRRPAKTRRKNDKPSPGARDSRHWDDAGGSAGSSGRRPTWDPQARIEQLEARKNTLGVQEAAELAWLYGDHGRSKDAAELLTTWLEAHAQDSAGQRFALFALRPVLATRHPELARPLAAEALRAGPLHEAHALNVVLGQLLEGEVTLEAVNAALEIGRPLGHEALVTVLQQLSQRGHASVGDALIEQWRKARGDEVVLAALDDWRVTQLNDYRAARVVMLQALIGGKPPRLDLVDNLIASVPADDAGLKKGTIGLVTDVCSRGSATLAQCQRWLGSLSPDGGAEAALAEIRAARLKHIDTIRAQDVGNPELIVEFAAALRAQGRAPEADRLLSEMVEFAPHAYDVRVKYVAALRQAGHALEVCREYSVAVQLEPRMRDHFKHMMSLRRDFGADQLDPAALRECIVQGVSNLPVNRNVSLVLTWEDPAADIDLHIHEVGDHHVYYQRRESPNGGLLYYDITDGLGPEIYVLGSGPKGTYKLSLVYYARGSGKVRGTLTVLENAGSRSETRKDIPFELSGPDSKVEVPIYELTL